MHSVGSRHHRIVFVGLLELVPSKAASGWEFPFVAVCNTADRQKISRRYGVGARALLAFHADATHGARNDHTAFI